MGGGGDMDDFYGMYYKTLDGYGHGIYGIEEPNSFSG